MKQTFNVQRSTHNQDAELQRAELRIADCGNRMEETAAFAQGYSENFRDQAVWRVVATVYGCGSEVNLSASSEASLVQLSGSS